MLRWTALCLAGVGLALAACGSDRAPVAAVDSSSTSGAPTATTTTQPQVLVACGAHPYPPSALSSPTGEENDTDAAATALRVGLQQAPAGALIPESGWRRLFDDGTDVVFGADDPAAAPGSGAIYEIAFHDDGTGYKFAGSASACVPHAQVPGRSLASFFVAPGQVLDAATTEVAVVVTERVCTSGTPMGDRLGQPTVNYTASTVDVIYTAAPLGSDGEFFNCQGNPASHVTLHLDQPLGARQLRDASTFPPTDATNPH